MPQPGQIQGLLLDHTSTRSSASSNHSFPFHALYIFKRCQSNPRDEHYTCSREHMSLGMAPYRNGIDDRCGFSLSSVTSHCLSIHEKHQHLGDMQRRANDTWEERQISNEIALTS